jgi:lipopolysaccharide transport system ATP-binding protein
MSDAVIRVRGVGKRYRLGAEGRGYQTLRDTLARAARAPLERWRRGGAASEAPLLWALRDVSFDVGRGEVVGIIGRNGAGKSTLLKILSRITPPTTGRVELRGRVGALLEIGTGFSPELTGRENVFLNGVILGMRRAEVARKLDEIVAFSGVESFLDTPVKHYSSGMRVRLAFAVAAHLQPEILLLDEVLAVGDIDFQRRCIGRMEQVARDGRTVILVSHHLATIRALCHRTVLLDAGRVERIGPPGDVVEHYLGAYAVAAADQAIAVTDQRDGVREIRLWRVILDNGVAGRFVVPWQEPIRLRFEFDVLRPLDDVSFGAGIRTLDGVSVFTVHHDDDGAARWRLGPGRYSVELTIDNCLRPGLYRLHVGADQGRISLRNVLHVECIHLEVLGYAADQAVPAASNTGYVNGRSVWQSPVPAATPVAP